MEISLNINMQPFQNLLHSLVNNADLEAHITNRQKHAIVAEFGSGIYGEAPGAPKSIIYPRNAKALIIPVLSHYSNNYSSEVEQEARQNAAKHPDIMGKLAGSRPGLIGFIFRYSMKGMKPIRMVRDSMPDIERKMQDELQLLFSSGQMPTRQALAAVVNKMAAMWLIEIVKKSPVLTSNLRSGWTVSKFAS